MEFFHAFISSWNFNKIAILSDFLEKIGMKNASQCSALVSFAAVAENWPLSKFLKKQILLALSKDDISKPQIMAHT